MAKKVRIDKYLCTCLDISRKEAKEYIRKGRICVGGQTVKKPEEKVDQNETSVLLDGKILGYEEFHYLMLHKPQGVVSATKDNHDQTVVELIKEPFAEKLFPVGRLDKDTEGLLLLTDDGELAHKLLSPKKHVEKTYYAKAAGHVRKEAIDQFAKGVSIGGGETALPAKLEILSASEIESQLLITITEGKFHQVKRMVRSIGSEVLYLKRLSMGSLVLDDTLKPGSYRRLTKDEISLLKEQRC